MVEEERLQSEGKTERQSVGVSPWGSKHEGNQSNHGLSPYKPQREKLLDCGRRVPVPQVRREPERDQLLKCDVSGVGVTSSCLLA